MGISSTNTINPDADAVSGTKRPKSKKHSKKDVSSSGGEIEPMTPALGDQEEKPPNTFASTSGSSELQPEKVRSKTSKAGKVPKVEGSVEGVPVASKKKEKKRNHRDVDSADGGDDGTLPTPDGPLEELEPPKKKHKNRTEFRDPRDDSSLNRQSRKGLEYVFTQMNKPKKWKFNKARQNWIMRNIWSPENLPDIYFPLAVKYLANVQGGSRKKLQETCQTYLKVEEKPEVPEPTSTTTSTVEAQKPLKPSLKASKPTPGSLVNTTPTPGPLVGSVLTPGALITPLTTTPVVTSASASPASCLAETRRKRAQTLLGVLS
ncbi:hypothetical protein NLJ89_g8170 [Agrocybe chaxingu]|uniref:WKF domain-containing protein n=1 Tax=Agrocybe chaxingu TaxID=84603 RepID=A0A9W8JVY5_9AGAR|nr:hypothetical protein NLJ89_g8170 [Agrocybe chaxingu]